jgi:hypothetical protein
MLYCRVHNSLSLALFLSQINPVHILPYYVLDMFQYCSTSTSQFSKRQFTSEFPTKILFTFLYSPVCVTYPPTDSIQLVLVTPRFFDLENQSHRYAVLSGILLTSGRSRWRSLYIDCIRTRRSGERILLWVRFSVFSRPPPRPTQPTVHGSSRR